MKILKEVYEKMMACPGVPPESGGILGTSDGRIINHVLFDKGLQEDNEGMYYPDISFLNQTIENWTENGIRFQGLFHTHAPQWPVLSNDDKFYIVEILNVMPSNIEKLYFPLVFPGQNIKAYIAKRQEGIIVIFDDNIEIVEKR